jgi:hypothetical protein
MRLLLTKSVTSTLHQSHVLECLLLAWMRTRGSSVIRHCCNNSLPASASTTIAGWTLTPPTRARISMHCLHQPAPACPACISQHGPHQQALALLLCSSFQVRCHQSCATEWQSCVKMRACAGAVTQRDTATATALQERPSNIGSQCNTTQTLVQVHALSHRHATTMHERATRRERRIGAASARNAEARRNNSMLCTQQHALHASECPACTSMAC